MNFDFTRFFYNILPGSFFIIYWSINRQSFVADIKEKTEIFDHEWLTASVLIIFSLLLGILLHGIWRLLIWGLEKVFKIDKGEIYNKNIEIWSKKIQSLPEFFSMRAAMWGSIIIGLIISWLFLEIHKDLWYYYLLSILLFIFLFIMDRTKNENTILRMHEQVIDNDVIKPEIKKNNDVIDLIINTARILEALEKISTSIKKIEKPKK